MSLKNNFFGICMPIAYYFCMLPPDILPNVSLTYTVYSKFIYALAIFCHASQLIKLIQIITDENFIFDELIRNYVITAYHFTTVIKCYFLRGKISGSIFKQILEYEEKIYNSQNEDVLSIYRSTISYLRATRRNYMGAMVIVLIFYICAPLFRDPYYILKGNETIIVPQVPLSSWTLVDDHYWYAFTWTTVAGTYLTILFANSDLIIFSLISFGTCQLNILHHYISNFLKYSCHKADKTCCTQADAMRALQKECIMMHQNIINYVNTLNGSLKKIMVLDFLPGSIQLAGLIFQIMTNFSMIQCILVSQMIGIMIARLYIYCDNVHVLAEQSQSIATAWYDIDWTDGDIPQDVKKNMVICICRAQKPLKITIADFQDISVGTFLAILKGTYSYMMLLNTI